MKNIIVPCFLNSCRTTHNPINISLLKTLKIGICSLIILTICTLQSKPVFSAETILPLGFYYNNNSSQVNKNDLSQIKNYVRAQANIPNNSTDNLDVARKLRNFVYQHTVVGKGRVQLPITYTEFKKIINGAQPLLCGGISTTYYILLQLFDMPTRIVQLAANSAVYGNAPNDTLILSPVHVFDGRKT